ncbi:MAG: YncE family protein [Desulfocapsa sp.]|nr:YncE family protein [Desulfocapsa sp.]
MKKIVYTISVFLFLFFSSVQVKAGDYVYVVNSYVHAVLPEPTWSTVSKLSAGDLELVDTLVLPACNDAHSLALTHDHAYLWVTCPPSNTIEIIDTETFEIADTVNLSVLINPMGVAFAPDGSKGYVTSDLDGFGGVAIRNAADGEPIGFVFLGARQNSISFIPDGSKAYVMDYQNSIVTVIQTSDNTFKTVDFDGTALQDAVVSPDGSRVYVSNMDENQIEVIQTSDDMALDPIETDYIRPRGIAISPDGRYLFVGHYLGLDSLVTMLRLSDQTVVATADIPSNPRRIAINRNGTRIFVTEHNEDEVYAYDVSGETLTYAASADLNVFPGYQASPVGIVLSESPFPWHLFRSAIDNSIGR